MEKYTYQQTVEETMNQIASSKQGLSSSEVEKRKEKYGLNEIEQGDKKSVLTLFLENFKDPMIIILLIVAAIQIALGSIIESLVILAVVIVSAVITVVQEKQAEQSLDSLRSLSAPTANVIRDGKVVEVESKDIVPGDIIKLEVGDYIPADGRLFEAESLQVEEGALTGESVPADKELTVFEDDDIPLGDRANMVFRLSLIHI